MSENNNNDLGAFLAGFVIGGLVGAATALILAPQTGEETRTKLSSRSRDLRDSGGERMQDYRQRAGTYTQDYRGRAGQALAGTRGRVQETGSRFQEQARIVLDVGKERVTKVRDHGDSQINMDDEQTGDPTDADATATA